MVQSQIWGRGTGKVGEWKSLTQGTQGEKPKVVATQQLRVSPPFLHPKLQNKIIIT